MVWRTLARDGTRRGVPEGLVPVVLERCVVWPKGGLGTATRKEHTTRMRMREMQRASADAGDRRASDVHPETRSGRTFLEPNVSVRHGVLSCTCCP